MYSITAATLPVTSKLVASKGSSSAWLPSLRPSKRYTPVITIQDGILQEDVVWYDGKDDIVGSDTPTPQRQIDEGSHAQ